MKFIPTYKQTKVLAAFLTEQAAEFGFGIVMNRNDQPE